MKNFLINEIKTRGKVCESFQARVELLEDKVIRGKGEPYLKILLSQKGGSGHTISAIAVGDAYLFAKRTYKVGEEYTFPAGLFNAQRKQKQYRTWSNSEFDLWFTNT